MYNLHEKCRYYDQDEMTCTYPDIDENDRTCIGVECDCFELECPHCKKIIKVDDLWN